MGHRRGLFLAWLAAAALFTWMNASAWNAYHAAEEEVCKGQYDRLTAPFVVGGRPWTIRDRLGYGSGSFRQTEMWMHLFDPFARYMRSQDEPGGSIRLVLTRDGWKAAGILLDGELCIPAALCIRLWPF